MEQAAQAGTNRFDHRRGRSPLLRQTRTLASHVFLTVNVAGFVTANAFLYYLATGSWFDFSSEAYRRGFGAPLTQMLNEPLSISTHPWMILVTGLLLGAVFFVPVLVAVLYRLWVSAPFVLAVAVVGHAPLLAVFLAIGCLLASGTPLRSNQPFLAMLVGLAPAALYLLLMFYLFFESQEHVLFPRDWAGLLPFVLALIAALCAAAVVLGLARLTKFRPGVIWPVLYVFLAAPLLVFHARVGAVEMRYALIAAAIDAGAGDALFSPQTVQDFCRQAGGPLSDEQEFSELLAAAERDLDRRRDKLLSDCAGFLTGSRPNARSAAVLWIRAVAPDVRVDADALNSGLVRYRYAGPTERTLDAWAELNAQYAKSPQAAVARARLGINALRSRQMREAWDCLRDVPDQLREYLSRKPLDLPAEGSIFAPKESLPGTEYYRSILDETACILWLMQVNRVLQADQNTTQAFAEYMSLWPFTHASPGELERLVNLHADTAFADNFRFQLAMTERDELARARKLQPLADASGDAAVQANYELGRLALRLAQTPAWREEGFGTVQEYFQRVPEQTPYHAQARQHLEWLARGGKTPAPREGAKR